MIEIVVAFKRVPSGLFSRVLFVCVLLARNLLHPQSAQHFVQHRTQSVLEYFGDILRVLWAMMEPKLRFTWGLTTDETTPRGTKHFVD